MGLSFLGHGRFAKTSRWVFHMCYCTWCGCFFPAPDGKMILLPPQRSTKAVYDSEAARYFSRGVWLVKPSRFKCHKLVSESIFSAVFPIADSRGGSFELNLTPRLGNQPFWIVRVAKVRPRRGLFNEVPLVLKRRSCAKTGGRVGTAMFWKHRILPLAPRTVDGSRADFQPIGCRALRTVEFCISTLFKFDWFANQIVEL